MSRIAAAALVVAPTPAGGPFAVAADIRLAGNAAELSVASISERTYNVEVAGRSTPPKRIEFRGEPVTLDP